MKCLMFSLSHQMSSGLRPTSQFLCFEVDLLSAQRTVQPRARATNPDGTVMVLATQSSDVQ